VRRRAIGSDDSKPRTGPGGASGRRRAARPGTWSRETIVAAMRDWWRLTASPPRSYEWAPATGRALGLLGPGQVRWQREHPRWPSTGAVRHHFGSFGAWLGAAGFRVPPRSELPAHEAAAAARRLASKGLSTKAIAVELAVAWATADGYLRGRDCPVCGRPKAKPTSRTCPSCRASMRAVPPRGREEIGELLRAWRRETGSAPRIADWRPGAATRSGIASGPAGREGRPSPALSAVAGQAPSPRPASGPRANGPSGPTSGLSPRSGTGQTPTAPPQLGRSGKRQAASRPPPQSAATSAAGPTP
jgi:hypothetical protein